MDKALRGQGCVMKRQKKADGGAMRDMPENLKEYLEDKKVNKNVDQKKRSIDNLRSIIETPKRKRPIHKSNINRKK
jgi:hypothetical protein